MGASQAKHRATRVVAAYATGTPPPDRPVGAVRLVLLSDTHEQEGGLAVPAGDVVVHAGDLSYTGDPQALRSFARWLRGLPHPHKVVVAGNHDLTLDPAHYDRAFHDVKFGQAAIEEAAADLRASCTYLENSSAECAGLRFWGSPCSPGFGDWAFSLDAEGLERTWAMIPQDTDVVVTHGPAYGHGDLCISEDRAGCKVLLRRILATQASLHVAGHIHEGRGVTHEGGVCFVNASAVNVGYQPVNAPIVVDIVPNIK
eukprot:m51a1_g11356 hypothetical protein (257) ;mRNA; r:7246-8136